MVLRMGMSFILLAASLSDCYSVLFRISSVFEIANGFSESVWQSIGEILGTYIGSAESQSTMNISILKTIMNKVPAQNAKEMIVYIIEYAQKISVSAIDKSSKVAS